MGPHDQLDQIDPDQICSDPLVWDQIWSGNYIQNYISNYITNTWSNLMIKCYIKSLNYHSPYTCSGLAPPSHPPASETEILRSSRFIPTPLFSGTWLDPDGAGTAKATLRLLRQPREPIGRTIFRAPRGSGMKDNWNPQHRTKQQSPGNYRTGMRQNL